VTRTPRLARVPGRFVTLGDGVTHYDVQGPDTDSGCSGARVLGAVVHLGFDQTALTAAGLRVARYDYYGRGFSDRPDIGTRPICSIGRCCSCSIHWLAWAGGHRWSVDGWSGDRRVRRTASDRARSSRWSTRRRARHRAAAAVPVARH
jgi:hypothetical protein